MLCPTPSSISTHLQLAATSTIQGEQADLVQQGHCAWSGSQQGVGTSTVPQMGDPTGLQSLCHKHCCWAASPQPGLEQLEAAVPAAFQTSALHSRQCWEVTGPYQELVYQPKVCRSFWTCTKTWREIVASQQYLGQT